jgi:uncharacterized protein
MHPSTFGFGYSQFGCLSIRGVAGTKKGYLFPMIVETIFSTLDQAGKANFAPMGLVWGTDIVIVRPFRNTQTCRNLTSGGFGVASLSDNVLAYVQSALCNAVLPSFPAIKIPGAVFQDACSWLELAVISESGSEDRADFRCRIMHKDRRRDFLGFCRAGNAVIEATILATRLGYYEKQEIDESLKRYSRIVEKTAGPNEKQAFKLVCDYVRQREGQ